MKKRTILFGSLLGVFLVLMIPHMSAIEYRTVEDTFESRIISAQEKCTKLNNKDIRLLNIFNSIGMDTDLIDFFIILLSIILTGGITVAGAINTIKFIFSFDTLLSLVWLFNLFFGMKNLVWLIELLRNFEIHDTC
jgi:hypothetical protein